MLVAHLTILLSKWMGSNLNELLCTSVVFFGVLMLVKIIQWVKIMLRLPPGPWGLPFFGYLLFLKEDTYLQYIELAKKYGNIFSSYLGKQLVVVISDFQVIRDMFLQREFTGRPHTEFSSILGTYGIINVDGHLWKEQRKFLLTIFRSFGKTASHGKKAMETRIKREVKVLIETLLTTRGEPTNPSHLLAISISNVICSFIMSVRFEPGERRFKRFMHLIGEGFKLFGTIINVNYFPVMRYLPHLREARNKIMKNIDEMGLFFQETIEEHRRTFDPTITRDLIDSYLLEIHNAKMEGREGELFQGRDHNRQMQQILGDLFSAGMETVKTTLEWAIIFMLHYPEAAKAVREELDVVVGRFRMPSLDDQEYLPITQATIWEILRKSSIVPLGTTHATTRDVIVNDYLIPAGSQVVPNIYAVHMDPKLWDQPEEFRPSRFLDSEGKPQKPKHFMPFGIGQRVCLGEKLANYEIFLFFTSLLHMYDFRLPEGESLPSLRSNNGVTLTPDPYKVCYIRRNFDVIDFNVANEQNGPLRNVGAV
ncbi:PREDICTED: cytochrome P450 18a1 [Polistes dominula]|uniref:Cytochrome P450 18a1 n=1 Tax=Polistes dominula TaxID=743375 RepID=A0ABM1ILT6_POLDO|nr:PREDICTED: cytochrome P450 18a1 [Polistes dominula]